MQSCALGFAPDSRWWRLGEIRSIDAGSPCVACLRDHRPVPLHLTPEWSGHLSSPDVICHSLLPLSLTSSTLVSVLLFQTRHHLLPPDLCTQCSCCLEYFSSRQPPGKFCHFLHFFSQMSLFSLKAVTSSSLCHPNTPGCPFFLSFFLFL